MSQAPSSTKQPIGPFKLVTVNPVTNMAKGLMPKILESISDRYTIIWEDNVESLENLRPALERINPDILGCASKWKPADSARILAEADQIQPGLMTFAVPYDIYVEEGPESVLAWTADKLSALIESSLAAKRNGSAISV